MRTSVGTRFVLANMKHFDGSSCDDPRVSGHRMKNPAPTRNATSGELMRSSLEAILAFIELDVPQRLISLHRFASMMSFCRLLPIEISSGLGFESRLAEKSADVDLILRAPMHRGMDILAGNSETCLLPDYLFQEDPWKKLRSLALDWRTWSKPLREALTAAWLEFDADQLTTRVPSPGLLFLQIGKSDCPRGCCGQIARTAYSKIKGHPIQSELLRTIDMCLNRLPDHARVLHVGMGISRPTEAIRLVVADLAPADMQKYLSSIGWAGDLRTLELLLLDVGRNMNQFNLDIDLFTSVGPKIGIECCLGGEERSAVSRSWQDFLDIGKSKGWCLPEKSEGLLQWPGRSFFQARTESWPWVVERFLNHSKINYDPVSGMEAKAYFGFVWRRASEEATSTKVS